MIFENIGFRDKSIIHVCKYLSQPPTLSVDLSIFDGMVHSSVVSISLLLPTSMLHGTIVSDPFDDDRHCKTGLGLGFVDVLVLGCSLLNDCNIKLVC